MQIVSQTEAAKILGIAQSAIGRYLSKGKIRRYDKSKVCVEEIRELRQTTQIQINNNTPKEEKQTASTKKPQADKTNKSNMTFTAARTHREAFNAKIAEVTYKEKVGELITLDSAKGIIEVMFSPLSRKLDDVHIDLKSRYPDIPLEAIEWLSDYINNIKKSVSEHKW